MTSEPRLDGLVLSTRARNTLLRNGLASVEDIDAATDDDLLACPGCGLGQLEEIRDAVARFHAYGPAKPRQRPEPAPDLAVIDIRAMGLRRRTLNALLAHDLYTVADVEALSRVELVALPGFGTTCWTDWRHRLAAAETALADGRYLATHVNDLGDLSSTRRQGIDVGDLELSEPVVAALRDLGVTTCLDLTSFSRDDLHTLLGPEKTDETCGVMALHDLTFRDTVRKGSFAEPLAHLREFAAAHGHTEVPRDHLCCDYRLGQWVMWMRNNHARGTLDTARVRILETFPGWIWNLRGTARARARQAQLDTLSELLDFAAAHGHVYPSHQDPTHRPLAKRLSALRAAEDVDPEVRAAYDDVADWTWDGREALARTRAAGMSWQRRDGEIAFAEWVERLTAYATAHGHASPKAEYVTDEGHALGMWVARTRRRRDDLSPEQTLALESVSGWYWDGTEFYADARWRSSYDRARAHIAAHGIAAAYDRFSADGSFRVGSWLALQAASRDTLSQTRRDLLELLPGFVWRQPVRRAPSAVRTERAQARWAANVDALRNFLATTGRLPVTAESHQGKSIGQWCVAQRFAYRRGNLSPERVAILDAIDGWKWVVPVGVASHVARTETKEEAS